MTRVPAFALVFVAACFNPTFNNPTCGPNGECPNGTTCVDGTCRAPDSPMDDAAVDDDAVVDHDAQPLDAMPDGPPPECVGSGTWEMCVAAGTLTAPTTLAGTINTDTSSLCTTAVTWKSASQPNACVIAGTSITISGSVIVTGGRPLVLFTTGTITMNGIAVLDVASHRAGTLGPGRQPAACAPFVGIPGDNNVGAGGGAAGSFMTKGGNGGMSGPGNVGGVAAEADTVAPTVLRGGCRGENGGSAGTGTAGAFGAGGGAVYLLARTSIALSGTLNASGAGGGEAGIAAGGGGAGSGGMIVLWAPSITSSNAKLMANGGGGGGGGGGQQGKPGDDPTTPTQAAQGGEGGSGNTCGGSATGGDGSVGSNAGLPGFPGSSSGPCGGGGGGGGGGYIRANVAISGATFSPPLSVVP